MEKFNPKMDFILRKKFEEFILKWNYAEPTRREDEDELFEEFCCYYLLNDWVHNSQSPNVYSTTSDGDDHGIDGYRLLVNDALCQDVDDVERIERDSKEISIKVRLLQAKNAEDISLASHGKFISGVDQFLSDEEWSDTDEKFDEVNIGLRDAHNAFVRAVQSAKLRRRGQVELIWAVSSRRQLEKSEVDDRVDQLLEGANRRDHLDPFEIDYCGADDLVQKVQEFGRQNECEIIVNHSHRYPELGDGKAKGFSGLIPVEKFLEIIAPNGVLDANVFDENVRDFIGNDTEPNSAMAELLKDKERRWQFAFRNNGVTIVAEDLGAGFSDRWILKNYQIVNGCQTSNVIYENREHLRDAADVLVPIRIIGTENDDLLDAIVTSTNSQNAIKGSDLSARTSLARQLAVECERHRGLHGIVFERRKGQFNRASVAHSAIVNKDEFTRSFVAMVLNLPHAAIGYWDRYASGDSSIWELYIPPETLYLTGVLSKSFDKLARSKAVDRRYAAVKYHALAYYVRERFPALQIKWSNEVFADQEHRSYRHLYSVFEEQSINAIKAVTSEDLLETIRPLFERVDDLGDSDIYRDRVGGGAFSRMITKTGKFSKALDGDIWGDA